MNEAFISRKKAHTNSPSYISILPIHAHSIHQNIIAERSQVYDSSYNMSEWWGKNVSDEKYDKNKIHVKLKTVTRGGM